MRCDSLGSRRPELSTTAEKIVGDTRVTRMSGPSKSIQPLLRSRSGSRSGLAYLCGSAAPEGDAFEVRLSH